MSPTPPEPALWTDDCGPAAAYGADPAEVAEWVERFGHGECGVLAARMHEWTGWPVWELRVWQHYCVRRPDGALVDAYGVFRPEDDGDAHVAARYDGSVDDWVEKPRGHLCTMDDDMRDEIDGFLDSPWGLAILPRAQRRLEPIYYPDLDLDPAEHPRVRDWLAIRGPLDRQLRPLGEAVISALGVGLGDQVLDVGCGIGGTPHDLAEVVGPQGRVFAIEMLQAAVDVLRADPVPPNVRLVCGDAQDWPFEPAAFDAVFSRFGVMFFADPEAAFANLRRALRPAGRLGFVCWRPLADNELDALPLSAAAPHLPPDLVDGTAAAAWFSFADPDAIRAVLAGAGFTDIQIVAHDAPVGSGDLQAMTEVCSTVGALGAILREHPQFRPAAVAALEDTLRPRDGPGGPHLNAAVWIVTARAP